jgi:predicted ATPase
LRLADHSIKKRDSRLRKISAALKLIVPQLSGLLFETDRRGKHHLKAKYDHWRKEGAWQGELQFSDGTLRLIGLFWNLLEGEGPLLLEEPELSVHPKIVRKIPQMLARLQLQAERQVLMSTHSADLLNDPGIGLDEVLLLIPGSEGTKVMPANRHQQIRTLLEGGLSLSDAVVPYTEPPDADTLPISFPDISK